MSDFADTFDEVMIFADTGDSDLWWKQRKIRRDLVLSNKDQIHFLPASIVEKLLMHKVITNKPWERDHLLFLREETIHPFVVQERYVMFVDEEDMSMFLLKFRE